jgi:hypothetical protein
MSEVDDDIAEVDRLALDRAIQLTLAEDDQGRVEQVQSMLKERSWGEVAEFCAYHQQSRSLNINPWESTPSSIDPNQIDEIIARGPEMNRKFGAARLLKKMLAAGVSSYDPTPLESIGRAKQSR